MTLLSQSSHYNDQLIKITIYPTTSYSQYKIAYNIFEENTGCQLEQNKIFFN